MGIFINRILNMKRIKAIGFDMDYTLVRYHSENSEALTYSIIIKKLISEKGYPKTIENLTFDYQKVIQGLVIDKKRGNLIKLSRYGKAKSSSHGLIPLNFNEQKETYGNRVVDLNDSNIQSLDTSFSISNGVLYAQLVNMKDQGVELPNYETLAHDIKETLDLAHSDGSLKNEVRANIDKYIIQDPEVARLLERYKGHGKKLLVITNSDYTYTQLLLDHTINPFLKEHKHWSELFDITICYASKPRFFTHKSRFLKIDPTSGSMTNTEEKIEKGIYQGGWAGKLQKDLGLEGDEILYLGDHIYGDVVTLKKTFNWRTALVLDPLADDIQAIKTCAPIQSEIDDLMAKKEYLEAELNSLDTRRYENKDVSKEDINQLYAKIEDMNGQISELLEKYKEHFNPHWGELMRAGQEESRFADQVQKYACIYMSKVSDLLSYSPRTYFRPGRRVLPHELV